MADLGLIARRYSGVPPGRRPECAPGPGDKIAGLGYCPMSLRDKSHSPIEALRIKLALMRFTLG
jgi:hypothetical protein